MSDYKLYGDIDLSTINTEYVDFECPCIVFHVGNDPFSVMLNNMKEGNIPLIYASGDIKKVFDKRISGSAYNIQKLLKVLPGVEYYNEKGVCFEIKTIKDYLDAVLK